MPLLGRNFKKSLSAVQIIALCLLAEAAISASNKSALMGLKFAASSASDFVRGTISIPVFLRKFSYLTGDLPAIA